MQQILNDMGDDSDQLPVMQHTLARMYELWKRRGTDGPLDLEDYESAGSLASALNDHAQSIYDGLSPADREWARKLFRCLVKVDERGREVRRPGRPWPHLSCHRRAGCGGASVRAEHCDRIFRRS